MIAAIDAGVIALCILLCGDYPGALSTGWEEDSAIIDYLFTLREYFV